MRSYILTERERGLLKTYLESGVTSDAFWVLLNRINANYEELTNDIHLIKVVKEKRSET